ncbi:MULTISPECIES: DUF4197 domain-containing protein [Pseudomonas]|uniref:DUF4197 domain-containing protein n=1 Tax=Pseudomonas neustonica TaxID=2487346 RepID=A0ABX9XID9_9PSED|nr:MULTISPECIES: DUF4197 domain-containing protein [Pseudomonas]MAB24970.1 hypothetical protein [Pseudomonadales bacterium]MBA6421473.1 DUF4197 domain-containing protein [Pseudomonas sp. 5Ae-yellow]ROZ83301.1 DUF4197 domain-containing protein [Pseudomonas sp. SSM44]ROZ85170.1 DUF4197 domain-containing protein [Pseudomonas neustonica]|tara:strand:- start:1882 stop:2568 length:687 start_codon:yes stop_codon:yes gene_type:complete
MPRLSLFAILFTSLISTSVSALSLSDLSQQDAGAGLKDALIQGADMAVKELSAPGGFSDNPDVRIELPGNLGKASRTLKMMGMGGQISQLEDKMNQAAEAAVPQAQSLLVEAIRNMSVQDAKAILTGPNDSATNYLESSSRDQIRALFLPVVKNATDQVGLAQQYNTFASQAANFGVVDSKDASVEGYVTERTLDGLFEIMAAQEADIRSNPAQAATNIAKRVFGSLQ